MSSCPFNRPRTATMTYNTAALPRKKPCNHFMLHKYCNAILTVEVICIRQDCLQDFDSSYPSTPSSERLIEKMIMCFAFLLSSASPASHLSHASCQRNSALHSWRELEQQLRLCSQYPRGRYQCSPPARQHCIVSMPTKTCLFVTSDKGFAESID